MRNPITKLILAAIILIACITGIIMWTHTGSGIALANVLARVQQSTAYMYQMTMTIKGMTPSGQDMNQNVEGTALIAQGYGIKMTMDMTDPNSGKVSRTEMYMLPQEKAMITLMPDDKVYMRVELDDTLIEETRQQNYDPGTMLQQILDSEYKSLGRSAIDGVEVEGFQTTDPNYLAGMIGQVDVKIWVDVKTQLPVRSEMDMEMYGMQMHAVVHSFQWDYPVDADTFKPVIPADYTALPGSGMKMPAMNEESAIAGLKLCADLAGRYPEKLDFPAVTSLMDKLEDKEDTSFPEPRPPAMPVEEDAEPIKKENLMKIMELPKEERDQKMREYLEKMKQNSEKREQQWKEWDEQHKKWQEQVEMRTEQMRKRVEQPAEITDKVMPIMSTATFYTLLAAEKKDPAYYGNVVAPQDADKILMRWKLSDNEYRVIYGDLHAETVTPERLAELEAALPI